VGRALAQPTQYSADVVFFVDASDTMCFEATAKGINAAVRLINDSTDVDFDVKFQLYYVPHPSNTEAEQWISWLDWQTLLPFDPLENFVIGQFDPAIMPGDPPLPVVPPPCLDADSGFFGSSCDAFSRPADWGHALAWLSWYHPWRQSLPCNSGRIFIPISNEGPRCGDPCDSSPPNPTAPLGGDDWRAVEQATRCARVKGVQAWPIVGCCDFVPSPPPPPVVECTANECQVILASLMAERTTGDPTRMLNIIGNAPNLQAAFAVRDFIWDRVIQEVIDSAAQPCDSIDFNNDDLFPSDEDLIDFLTVLAGGQCSNGDLCNDVDFNNNCLFPEDQDIIAFVRVLAGGDCIE
jgi:hypothetical protein